MKLYGTLVVLAILLMAGYAMSSKANHAHEPEPGGFDQALSNFQEHLVNCPYPAAHVMVFARSWNIPEFVIQAYVPKTVAYDKGKAE